MTAPSSLSLSQWKAAPCGASTVAERGAGAPRRAACGNRSARHRKQEMAHHGGGLLRLVEEHAQARIAVAFLFDRRHEFRGSVCRVGEEFADVARDSRRARDGADQPVGKGVLRADDPDLFETIKKTARIAQHLVQGAQPRWRPARPPRQDGRKPHPKCRGKDLRARPGRTGSGVARPHSSAARGPLR